MNPQLDVQNLKRKAFLTYVVRYVFRSQGLEWIENWMEFLPVVLEDLQMFPIIAEAVKNNLIKSRHEIGEDCQTIWDNLQNVPLRFKAEFIRYYFAHIGRVFLPGASRSRKMINFISIGVFICFRLYYSRQRPFIFYVIQAMAVSLASVSTFGFLIDILDMFYHILSYPRFYRQADPAIAG